MLRPGEDAAAPSEVILAAWNAHRLGAIETLTNVARCPCAWEWAGSLRSIYSCELCGAYGCDEHGSSFLHTSGYIWSCEANKRLGEQQRARESNSSRKRPMSAGASEGCSTAEGAIHSRISVMTELTQMGKSDEMDEVVDKYLWGHLPEGVVRSQRDLGR